MMNNKNNNLIMSPAPHIHAGSSVSGVMISFIIALFPLVVFAIYNFGWHAVRVISVSVSSCVIWELLIQMIFRRKIKITDGTAFVTGLLFAMLLPASAPWWLVVTGTLFAMLIGKHIYGGNGANPFNPVLISWAALNISWKDYMDYGTALINYDLNFSFEYPLTVLKKSGTAGLADVFSLNPQDIWAGKLGLFLGSQAGGLGTAAGLLILAGGIFLIIRGAISWRIPFFYSAAIIITSMLFWLANPEKYADPVFHLVTGMALFGAFFLATDYAGSPVNKTAMAIFGLGCGFLTIIFRMWSNYYAVPFAVLLMNILNPLLDRIRPRMRKKNVNLLKVEP